MPLELTSTESSTFVITASADVTYAEVAVLLDELLAHSRLRAGVTLLVDSRTVQRAPSTGELRIIAHDLKPLREMGVAAFRRLEDAEQWLESFNAAA